MKKRKKSLLPEKLIDISGQKALHDYMESLEGKSSYSEFPELKSNPFISLLSDELQIRWVKKGKNGEVVSALTNYINTDTGEIEKLQSLEGGKMFYQKKVVDSNTYTKIYNKTLKEMFSLSSTALKLFGYFISQIDFKDKESMIYMDLDDAMVFCEYDESSRSMIYKGLTELIQKGFLCKTVRPWTFYMNPKFVHNGDRVSIWQEYEIDTKDKIDNMIEV